MARRTAEVRKPRDIGDAIRVVREARGVSQEELAEANAYDRFYRSRLEAGNAERLQAGTEIGERPTGYRRRRSRP